MAARAVIFDFNGTISDDEPLLELIFRDLFAPLGLQITTELYFERLAGLSDPAIVERALEIGGLLADERLRARLLRAKVDRYRELTTQSPAIAPEVAAFVAEVARRVPVAIASGAVREEVEHGLALAGIRDLFAAIVCIDDIDRGKPDPQGYEVALQRLNASLPPRERVTAAQTLVFEDADAGVQAAHAAQMRTVAIAGPAYNGAPVAADLVVERLQDAPLERLLAPAGAG